MTKNRQEFKNWLEADTNRKENLTHWEEFFELIRDNCSEFYLSSVVDFCWNSNDTPDNIKRYFNIYIKWGIYIESPFFEFTASFLIPAGLLDKKQEFQQLKSEKNSLETKLEAKTATLNAVRQKLDQSGEELTKNLQGVAQMKEFSQYEEVKMKEDKGKEIIEVITRAAKEYFGVDKEGKEAWEDALGIAEELKYIENKYKNKANSKTSYLSFEDWKSFSSEAKLLIDKINALESNLNQQIAAKEQEIQKLTQESKQSTAKLRQELEQLKKQKEQQIKDLTEQLQKQEQLTTKNQEQETQLTALNQIIFPTNNFDFTTLKTELHRLKLQDLVPQSKTKKTQLEQLITSLRQKAGTNLEKILELYCETYISMLKQNKETDNFYHGQLTAYKNILKEKIKQEDLQTFAKCQKEVLELEKQLKDFALQEEKYQNQIQVIEK